MRILRFFALLLVLPPAVSQESKPTPMALTGRDSTIEPAYDSAGRLQLPLRYREWIYLTSGIDMSYTPQAAMEGQSMFDNVFVNPAAYRAFMETGTWPDKTMLVLENRGARSHASINQRGHFQSTELMGLEVHVRDEAKTPGGWAFYAFDDEKPAQRIPAAAPCYSCHQQHAAVATTFVQFYPTLLPVATAKKTLSAAYLKDVAGEPAGKVAGAK